MLSCVVPGYYLTVLKSQTLFHCHLPQKTDALCSFINQSLLYDVWWNWGHVTVLSLQRNLGKWDLSNNMVGFPQYEGSIFTRCKLVKRSIHAHQDSKADPWWGSNSIQCLWWCFALYFLFCYQETLVTLSLNWNIFISSSTDHTNT